MALVLIALSVLVKGLIVQEAFFKEDDFEFSARAVEDSLGWDYLTRMHHGQFMPGGFLLAWVLTRIAPYSWGLVTGVGLVGHALAGLAVLHMLTVVFGRRRGILVPLAIFLFSVLTVPVTAWWAAMLNTIPLLIALPMAVAAHVKHLRTGRLPLALQAVGWVLFGLAFFLKAAVIVILLLALTLGYFRDRARVGPRTWILYGTALAGYVMLYFTLGGGGADEGSGFPGVPVALDLTWQLLGRTLATSVLGGPGRWFSGHDWATVSPLLTVVIVALVLLAVLVALTIRYRRRAVWAWLILLGYVLAAGLAPVLVGRAHMLGGFLGSDTRYLADAVPVMALVIGLLTMPVVGEAEPYRRELPSREVRFGTGGMLLGGFLVGSLISITLFGTHLGSRRAEFIANARQALAELPNDRPIFDRVAPDFMISPTYGEYALLSRIVLPLAPQRMLELYLPGAGPEGLVFDDQGRLRPVTVDGRKVDPPGSCWKADGTDVVVPLHEPVPLGGLVRLGTYSPGPGRVTLVLGDDRKHVEVGEGLSQIYFTAPGDLRSVRLTEMTQGVKMCFGDLTIGRPVAAP
ncbi:hypothetical protein GCM10022248_32750 [Nonomuraea soli]